MNTSNFILKIVDVIAKDPWIIAKPFFLVGFLVYTAFAIIVVRQVKLMSQTLNGLLYTPLRLISLIHLGVAIGVFILTLLIL